MIMEKIFPYVHYFSFKTTEQNIVPLKFSFKYVCLYAKYACRLGILHVQSLENLT
uniref:Uncharacterized protein n=1 Tax=Anguilla anguilla TaxID=7936 RepID=A0A0E9QNI8_ANGAN